MIVVSSEHIYGETIVTSLGTVSGTAICSRSQAGNFLGKLRAIAGGRMSGYEKIMREARDAAIAEMIADAQKNGADAIVAFRIANGGMTVGDDDEFVEVLAYGTAVQIKKTV